MTYESCPICQETLRCTEVARTENKNAEIGVDAEGNIEVIDIGRETGHTVLECTITCDNGHTEQDIRKHLTGSHADDQREVPKAD